MEDDVLKFIERFTQGGKNKGTIDTFSNGCCYWFAVILKHRFPWSSVIVYDPIANHFATKIDGDVFDITGKITSESRRWIPWDNGYEDKLHAERIQRDCINF